MSEKDGGSAFPAFIKGRDIEWLEAGMSLRDYFAAHAPKPHDAWTSSTAMNTGKSVDEVLARHAYAYADHMLAVRNADNAVHAEKV